MKRSRHDDVEFTGSDQDYAKVLKHQADAHDSLAQRQERIEQTLEQTIASSEQLLQSLGRPLPAAVSGPKLRLPALDERPWAEILAEARNVITEDVGLADLLSADEMVLVEKRINSLRGEFDAKHRLDAIDWCIAGVAGTLAALVDTFAVKLPRSPGMLGSARTDGGPLSNFVRDRLRAAYSPQQIADLEKRYSVPFDAAHSGGLGVPVPGLSPRTHRFQTLGHDPLLGFLFGVADILRGTMTAIGSDGSFIVQGVKGASEGQTLFEAIAQLFGHLRSDVSTPAGLPAPLMPLLQLLQVGKLGERGYTIGELSRLMYAKGYDFGHFIAMSVPTMMIEALVRIAYGVKRIHEGHDLLDAVPLAIPGRPRPPKLQTMLFVAHLIATSVNAGRVAITQNPLAINFPEWVMFARIGLRQLKWVLVDKEAEHVAHVQVAIDERWDDLHKALATSWTSMPFGNVVVST